MYTTMAGQTFSNAVLPFFDEHGITIAMIFSGNGREYCGRPDQLPYELLLQFEQIEHRTTKVRRQQSSGFIERRHRPGRPPELPHQWPPEDLPPGLI